MKIQIRAIMNLFRYPISMTHRFFFYSLGQKVFASEYIQRILSEKMDSEYPKSEYFLLFFTAANKINPLANTFLRNFVV